MWKKERVFCGELIKMTLIKKKLTKNVDILEVKIHRKNVVTILTI